jgi:uncharacterized protein YjiS (DUF1127 family)
VLTHCLYQPQTNGPVQAFGLRWDQKDTMPEKVMRTLSSTTVRLRSVATQPNQLIAKLQSWWVAYLAWRLQCEATLQLERLTDRELQDIGVRRCEIDGAVKGELNRARAFSRHY